MKTKVTFETLSYRVTYGHEPRGRGSWAFLVTSPGPASTPHHAADDPRIVWVNGVTYTAARRRVRELVNDGLGPLAAYVLT